MALELQVPTLPHGFTHILDKPLKIADIIELKKKIIGWQWGSSDRVST
jgi:hypothetical protein